MGSTLHRWATLATVACAVCGAGEMNGLAAESTPLDLATVERVAFVGNSITVHGPKEDIDWQGHWGMAATHADRDYVHRLVNRMEETGKKRLASSVRNLADFERNYAGYDLDKGLAETVSFRPDLVIVALGENVATLTSDEETGRYEAAFERLLQRLRRRSDGAPIPIIVRGTFWRDAAKDGAMKRASEKTGATFVSLDGLDRDESNFGRSERSWKHAGVGAHPGDRGMQKIADRIWSAIETAR